MPKLIPRRLLVTGLALPTLQGCAPALPELHTAASTPDARSLLASSAAAHGADALTALHDINVSYTGMWRPLVNIIQPDLVDAGFRGSSQERLLPSGGVSAQSHTGPKGHKQVLRQAAPGSQGSVHVWLNGTPTRDAERLAAAALVADGYGLFLLGPMLLDAPGAGRALVMERAPSERISVFGQAHECDVLRVRLTPGLGLSPADDANLYLSRADRLMRRVRFTLNGLDATQGAVAEVDTAEHVSHHGVAWPTRFHERLIRPAPIPVHDWRLTGLDVNRGFATADIAGSTLLGRAASPAAPFGG